MAESKPASRRTWKDPDDAPELTDECFDRADLMKAGRVVRRGRGRPRLAAPKEHVSLRLDADVLAHFKSTGTGWQTRINAALRQHLLRGQTSRKPKSVVPAKAGIL